MSKNSFRKVHLILETEKFAIMKNHGYNINYQVYVSFTNLEQKAKWEDTSKLESFTFSMLSYSFNSDHAVTKLSVELSCSYSCSHHIVCFII